MEEEVGFEPTVRSSRTTVFKTAPINRSGTPPNDFYQISFIVFTENILSILSFIVKLFVKDWRNL